MNPTVAWQAVPSTAAALPWSPVVASAATLATLAIVTRLYDAPPVLSALAAGTLASAAIAALHDPAEPMLAAVPTSRLSRRLLRLVLVATVVVPTLALIARLDPEAPSAAAATLALALTGLVAATWLPAPQGVPIATVLPVGWMLAGLWLDNPAPVHAAATWWSTHPWEVAVVSAATVMVGRHR